MRVKCTREGLIGGRTASGYVIDRYVPYVALPSALALHRLVKITNPKNGKYCTAFVLDIGPWNGGMRQHSETSQLVNTNDDEYVFGGNRPQSESGTDKRGRPTNGAGIDLGEYVWAKLELTDNQDVDWEFLMS